MSEQTSQEPTMEEILASIRRIISEDDTVAAEQQAAPAEPVEAQPEQQSEAHAEPVAEEAAAPEAYEQDDDEALELTEKVETMGDLDVFSNEDAPPPAALLAPVPEPAEPEPAAPSARPPEPVSTGLVSDQAASAAAAAFGALSATLAMPRSERTLEDVVRELLRPLLQQWLDDNLPGIVQTAVEAEVARIARSGGR